MRNASGQLFSLALCLVIIISAGCESLEEKGEDRLELARKDTGDIVVGVSWPSSIYSEHLFVEGIQLAVDEVNSRKLLGRTLKVIIKDDKNHLNKAEKIARQFANNPNMIAVIGHHHAEIAVRAAVTYEFSNLLFIAAAVQNNSITRHKFKYLIRTCINNQMLGAKLAAKTKEMGFNKPVVISVQNQYGRDLAHSYIAELDKIGIQVVQDLSISARQTDFRDTLVQMDDLDYDFVFFSGRNPEAAYFLRNLRLDGSNATFLGAFEEDSTFFEIAGEATEGAIYLEFYNPARPGKQNKKFVDAFISRYGKSPESWAASAYDAVMLLAHVIEQSKTTNPQILARNFHFLENWEGAVRTYSFKPNGDLVDVELSFKEVKSGQGAHLAKIDW